MSFRVTKVLSFSVSALTIMTALLCYVPRAMADDSIQAYYLQILHSARPYLFPAENKPSIAQLQSLLDIAGKYFSTKRQYEKSLFNQLQERQFTISSKALTQEPLSTQTPSVSNVLVEVFQNAVAVQTIRTALPADLMHLRDLLLRLKTLDQGHLSGMV